MEPLFTANFQYSFQEYKKYNRTVQNKIFRVPLLLALLMLVLLIVGFTVLPNGNPGFFLGWVITVPFIPLLYLLFSSAAIKRVYRSSRLLDGTVCRYTFYRDYFLQEKESGSQNIRYDQLFRILETKTNFYLMISKNQGFILRKSDCSPQLTAFLQNIKASMETGKRRT